MPTFVYAANLADLKAAGCMTAQVDGHTAALFLYGDNVYAVDNRCPHMGFPLVRGTVRDGILTCHWHHARFDLASGGTFDQWADDVRTFPVEIRGGEVWVDLSPRADMRRHHSRRLQDGLERNLPLVIAKAVNALLDGGDEPAESFCAGLDFGVRYRRNGWGPGLTIHTCMMNLLPHLNAEDRAHALYHGLSAVADDTDGLPPRFPVRPLPTTAVDAPTLKRWLRQFVEVRDSEGAERCIVSAVRAGADHRQLADMLFAAATDHRYIQIGHVADFTNKAFEALDIAGWNGGSGRAERVLTSLARGYAEAGRMEEANAWRHPVDLIEILEAAFEALPAAMEAGQGKRGQWSDDGPLAGVLLGAEPQAIAEALLGALREGCALERLAAAVAYAAALRIARFNTSNEFGDWDTALHTFTFANAVHQAIRRAPSPEAARGIFDAAMSVYLDRFLNVPAAPLPQPGEIERDKNPDALLAELPALLNRQQRVDEAGALAARYLFGGGRAEKLLAMLGKLLLREDRDFHTIQTMEAAFRQHSLMADSAAAAHVLAAAARYLAAHAPTMRAQGQTYLIAHRLSRGEKLFE